MPWRGKVNAYAVVPFSLADDGLWARESETICFDHELAIAIAAEECQFTSSVGVYPLDKDGQRLTFTPIAWYGTQEPPTDLGFVPLPQPVSGIRIIPIPDPAGAPPQLH